MKRLSLNDFKLKNDSSEKASMKMMSQVLGDCHDGPLPVKYRTHDDSTLGWKWDLGNSNIMITHN